jgi:hypothetical protein
MKFPVDFTEKVKLPAQGGGTGYPYRISAEDLMRDFYYAALDAEEGWIEMNEDSITPSRKLMLPKLPDGDGLFVLGCSGKSLQWVQTESCDTPTE